MKAWFRSSLCSLAALSLLAGMGASVSYASDDTGQPLALSLNSILVFALHNNPNIEQLREREVQADAFVKQKKSDLYPTISVAAEGGREFNHPSSASDDGKEEVNNSSSIALSLDQVIFDGFATANEIRERKSQFQSASYRTQAQIEDIINETVDTYLEAVRLQEVVRINQAFIEELGQSVNTIRRLFEAGAAGKVMFDYATSRYAFAQNELNNAESSLNDAISNLEFITGRLPPGFRASLPEELSPDKLDLEYYINVIEDSNSQILAHDSDIQAAKHRMKLEHGKTLPSVNFNLSADQSHNSGGSVGIDRGVSAMFSLNYNLFEGFKARHTKQFVSSQLAERQHLKEQTLKTLRREVKLAYNQFRGNQSSLELNQTEMLANRSQKELNDENFRLGNINVIELIESAERLKSSEIQHHEIIYNMYSGAYNLLVLAGILNNEYFCSSCENTSKQASID